MPRLIGLFRKIRRKLPQIPLSQPRIQKKKAQNSGSLSANQWIAIGGVGVSLLRIYYKREELMAMAKPVLEKFKMPKPAPEPAPEPASVEPKPACNARPRGLKKMI